MNVQLALAVKKRILAEPTKVYMDSWFEQVTKADQKADPAYKYLSCGTVGCIAGHVLFEALSPSMLETIYKQDAVCELQMSVQEIAASLLNLPKVEAEKLFFFHNSSICNNDIQEYEANKDYTAEREALNWSKPGTRDYARAVAGAIDRCLELNS